MNTAVANAKVNWLIISLELSLIFTETYACVLAADNNNGLARALLGHYAAFLDGE